MILPHSGTVGEAIQSTESTEFRRVSAAGPRRVAIHPSAPPGRRSGGRGGRGASGRSFCLRRWTGDAGRRTVRRGRRVIPERSGVDLVLGRETCEPLGRGAALGLAVPTSQVTELGTVPRSAPLCVKWLVTERCRSRDRPIHVQLPFDVQGELR
jgi:hypothetical protein